MSKTRNLTVKIYGRGPELTRAFVYVPRKWNCGGAAGSLLIDSEHVDEITALINEAEALVEACREFRYVFETSEDEDEVGRARLALFALTPGKAP